MNIIFIIALIPIIITIVTVILLVIIHTFASNSLGESSVTELDKISSRKFAKLKKERDTLLNTVNELSQQQQQYVLEQAKMNAILQAMPNGVIASSKDRNIFLANPKAEEILGVEEEELLGQFLENVVISKGNIDISIDNMPIKKALLGTPNDTKYTYIRPDKQKISLRDSANPIILDDMIIGAVNILDDITKQEETERAQKEFVSLASHQLRTPITSIKWNSELLLNMKLSSDAKEAVESIYQENERMQQLVSSLLSLSRIDLGTIVFDIQKIAFDTFVTDIINQFIPKISKRHITVTKNFSKIPIIHNDRTYLGIIMENLISNAIKYSKKNGAISINAVLLKSTTLHIEVKDDGLGIPTKDQGQIFGRLFRAQNAKQMETDGNGLGLYMVKKLIEEMGGRIWFDSAENQGTTFFIEIPITLKNTNAHQNNR